ncbi:GNAT family N-acetyltransferase [Haliea sp. E1-2-M8]|uniref:GNAT family N-acetyltransferase n=1 Tax=Haliea sp. E1-2-M8 TaxID=3064706 RepID=UPI002721F303|nr:GNAT family N-acetyltransferase [Haliea sp. E1-2-M8]MDO8861559.1 GNAT family N-acetyltransferase [Haliea sp. E1-2-M8]
MRNLWGKRLLALALFSSTLSPFFVYSSSIGDGWLIGCNGFGLKREGGASMTQSLDMYVTEFYDCEVNLSASPLDARQLAEFADSQMPRTGIGEVPWSTPLSSAQLTALTENGKAEFVSARMMLASVQEPVLVGIGALIRDPDTYQNPRMIIVVEIESRGQGLGLRIANELLGRLDPGEAVHVEVQERLSTPNRTARFFARLGFECVEENYRTGNVSEYIKGDLVGTVPTKFSLYEFTKPGAGSDSGASLRAVADT